MKLPWRRKPKATYCQWLCFHFTSAEEVARFYNKLQDMKALDYSDTLKIRMLQGGEEIPTCVI